MLVFKSIAEFADLETQAIKGLFLLLLKHKSKLSCKPKSHLSLTSMMEQPKLSPIPPWWHMRNQISGHGIWLSTKVVVQGFIARRQRISRITMVRNKPLLLLAMGSFLSALLNLAQNVETEHHWSFWDTLTLFLSLRKLKLENVWLLRGQKFMCSLLFGPEICTLFLLLLQAMGCDK